MAVLAGQSASDWGGDPQSCIPRCCGSHPGHCSSWSFALHMASRTQTTGTVWSSWIRKDHDPVQCTQSPARYGGKSTENQKKLLHFYLFFYLYLEVIETGVKNNCKTIFSHISTGCWSELLQCHYPRAATQDLWPLLWVPSYPQRCGPRPRPAGQVAGVVLWWDQSARHGQIRHTESHLFPQTGGMFSPDSSRLI